MTMHRVDCPPDPEYGQVWFDDRDAKCKVLTATAFMVVPTPEHIGRGGMMGGMEVGKPKDGDTWYGDNKKLKFTYGSWQPFNDIGDMKWVNGNLLRWNGHAWSPHWHGYGAEPAVEIIPVKEKPVTIKPTEPEKPEKSRVFTFD